MGAWRGLLVTTLRVVVIAFMACSAATRAVAQDTTGTMSGRIVDAQGLSLPGVAVTISAEHVGEKARLTQRSDVASTVTDP